MTNLTEQDKKDLLEKYPNINPDLIASQGTKPAPRGLLKKILYQEPHP